MKTWSLSRRLVVALTASLAGCWLLAVTASAFVMQHELNEVFDSALRESAQRLLPLAVNGMNHDLAVGTLIVRDALEQGEDDDYLIYQVRNASGTVILRSHDAPVEPFPVDLVSGMARWQGRLHYTLHAPNEGLFVQVGESESHRTEAILEGLAALAAPLLLLVPLAAMVVRWTVRRTLEPIADVRAAIGSRGGSDLAPLSDSRLPVELAPIVQDVNGLLARLGRVLEGERNFTANSAHELRTPIAAALAQTQRLASELEPGERRQRADHVATALRKLSNLVEKLMQLARAESGIAVSGEARDLLPALRAVAEEFSHRQGLRERVLLDVRDGELLARMDPDAFAIVIRNLLENALLHGAAEGAVRVVANQHEVVVRNEGDAVPPAQLERVFDRFQSDGKGTGLGLAIARAMMRQAGGDLRVDSPARGRPDGFEATASLANGSPARG